MSDSQPENNTSHELKKNELKKKRAEQDEKYRVYYEHFEERYQELLKQVVINDQGKEVYIPNFLDMQTIYPLVPTRIKKAIEPQYEQIRLGFETDLLQQENEYHEIKELYEDPLIYHHQQYEFIGDHQLPNFKAIQFPNIDQLPTLASGKAWNNMIRVDLPDKDFATDVISLYPLIPRIEELNEKYRYTRWPFITGPNTQESAFMHYQLEIEKIRPLQVYFKNDFFLEFKEWPSRTELTKRARILAKVYCKNMLQKEQDKIEDELNELRRIQREREDHDASYLRKLNELDQPKVKEEELPPPPLYPLNPDPSLQTPIVVYNPDLILRIQDLYKQIHDWLEERTFENYQKGKFKEALDWKRKREEVERDMVVITNPEQLLRILLLFKMTYKI